MSAPVHAIVMHRFEVPPERIFDACLDPAWVGRWMFGPNVRDERVVRLTLEARVGGRFSFVVNRGGTEVEHVGEYLEIDRPRLLVFTWATRENLSDPSRIIIELTPHGAGGCDVKLTHVMSPHWSAYVDRAAGSWSRMLDALERAIVQDVAAPQR
ncbi:MAG TPA: SRPBCC family protein [Opitutaceae bacterium]|nr:SRPBCC family protein [Opitutaceae bacterium]